MSDLSYPLEKLLIWTEQCHVYVLIFFSPSPLYARGKTARGGSNLAAKVPPARKQIKG